MKTLGMILTAAVVCGMSGVLYQKIWRKGRDAAALYIEGFFAFFCLSGVLLLPFIKLRAAFSAYCAALAACAGIVVLAGGFWTAVWLRASLAEHKTTAAGIRKKVISYAPAGLVFAALLFTFFLFEPSVGSDLTAETVFTTLQTNTLFEYNPATGRKLEIGIYPQSKLMILPVLYSVLFRMGGADMGVFLYRLVPAFVLGLHYLILGKWSVLLFPKEREGSGERRGLFLLFYGLLVWFGDYLPGVFSYRILHEGWKGESILAALVLPWIAYLCMDMLLHGAKRRNLCSIAAGCAAGVFLAPWKTAAALEAVTVTLFMVMWCIRRGWRCLKQRN